MLSRRAMSVLQLAVDSGEEIVADGIACYVGEDRTTWRVIHQLLRCLALKDVSDVKGLRRFVTNEIAEAVLRRPELADEIEIELLAGRQFTVQNDRIAPLAALMN